MKRLSLALAMSLVLVGTAFSHPLVAGAAIHDLGSSGGCDYSIDDTGTIYMDCVTPGGGIYSCFSTDSGDHYCGAA